jgi:hypothetical protein
MGTRITVTLKGPLGDADLLAGVVRDRCLVPAMTGRQLLRRRTPCGLP